MALDPAIVPTNAEENRAGQLNDIERRLRTIERGQATLQGGSGPPTTDPTTLREFTPHVDRTNRRLYVVVGDGVSAATHVWRYTALT